MKRKLSRVVQKQSISEIQEYTDYCETPREMLRRNNHKTNLYLRRYDSYIKFQLEEYRVKKMRVDMQKKEIERKDLQRKFLLSHRQEIFKKYNEIIERMFKEITLHRQRTRIWIGLIKLLDISTFIIRNFYVTL